MPCAIYSTLYYHERKPVAMANPKRHRGPEMIRWSIRLRDLSKLNMRNICFEKREKNLLETQEDLPNRRYVITLRCQTTKPESKIHEV